jgi:hypothetical protein
MSETTANKFPFISLHQPLAILAGLLDELLFTCTRAYSHLVLLFGVGSKIPCLSS